MLASSDDAEDVVQALFADLLAQGRVDLDLPYLYRAATRRCLNLLRDSKRRRALLDRQGQAVLAPPRSPLDDQIVSAQLLLRLCQVPKRKTAEVLVYRFCDDMTQDEIASLMGISRKTVGKRIDRIRKAARAMARHDEPASGGDL